MTAFWIIEACVYFVMAVAAGVARGRWLDQENQRLSGDARPFFAGLFWPITVLVVIGYAIADWSFDDA